MSDLYKYGVAVHLYKPIIKRGVVDFAVGADWTPAAGDVKISKDGGAAANVTNLPSAITMGNTAMWDFSLTATEMQAAKIRITVADSATKAVEDTLFEIDTYGNASAQHAIDLNDAVRAGLTALPNANAEAAGGLYTRGTGAGQIGQTTNGTVDIAVTRWGGNAVAATSVNGVPIVDNKYYLGTAITEGGAGRIAAAVTKFFDKATPTGTINSLPDAVPGAAGGLLVDDVWTDARAAKIDNLDVAVSTRGTGTALDAAGVRAAVGLAAANLDTQLSTIAGYVDTEVASVLADTADIKTRLPAALVGGRMDASISAIDNDTTALANFKRATNAIARGTIAAAASTTSLPTSSLAPAATVADQYKGRVVIFDKDTTTAALRGQATDITANTNTGILTVTALTTAPASGDTFVIV